MLAAFGLAACGGGGSSGTAEAPPDPPPTQAELDAMEIARLQGVINGLRMQLGLAPDADLGTSITALQDEIDRLEGLVQAAQDAKDEADRLAAEAAYKAMAATAAKLYRGISLPMGDVTSPAATDRAAAYNDAATAVMVSIGDGTNTPTAVSLSENKAAMVADNHGWQGKMYSRTTPASEGTYEAVVYSNVEEPTMGRKFGSAEPGSGDNRQYEYTLAAGTLTAAEADGVGETDNAFVAARVAFRDVTRTAGQETFRLPSPNPNEETVIDVPGSYHGVSGTYYCDTGDGTSTCLATVASEGFTLGGTGTWTFKPGDANARVMDSADTVYASYGWWIHKSADGGTFTASVFTDERGTVAAASGLNDLNGTAKYVGGAAGKYALTSATGGTNDAGHFTARATLEADFTTNTATDTTTNAITGTIDMFMGADGMPRDWEVELKGSPIGDAGVIGAATDGTVWTVDGTAGAAAGQWSGTLRGNGTDGVPQVATGTFYSTYGTSGGEGKMIGAFGVNKQ